jgi:hypothetical protein
MSRSVALFLMVVACLLGHPAAHAQEPFKAKPLDDPALAEVRGGYVSADGLSFSFGAQISTFVDNRLVLQSRLTLNDQGLSTEQTGMGAMGGFVSVPGQGGDTRVMQLLDPSRLGSVVLNTASNRDIRSDTALTLTVPGLADLQNQINLQRLGSQLNAAGAAATINRLGH